MSSVFFYHLTDSPLEAALPPLLEKCGQAGWRVVIRGTDATRMEWLDKRLWAGGDEAFLPHGIAGGPHDARQPILLDISTTAHPETQCLMAVDGATVSQDEVAGLARACVLFDGNDPDAVAAARVQWKTLTDANIAAQYWAQEDGRWIKKAETKGAAG